jgi:putative CocE/NonD family hydrolase
MKPKLASLQIALCTVWLLCVACATGEETPVGIEPLVRVVDVDVGETAEVELHDGSVARVKLLDLKETRDEVCFAVRRAQVTIEVDGHRATLVSANYRLPQTVAGVQIDCPITKGCNENGTPSFWGLDKDARLRLWPAGSPLIRPQTFTYPVKQKWFATDTQMANEPVHVDGGERAGKRKIYYHSGLDIGGSEGLVEIVAATDGLVVSVGDTVLKGHERDTPVSPRYDVVYLLDGRGWYYRYSHLKEIDKTMVPGRIISQGDRIGLLGKEGGSGGWSHLHFEIKSRQPSGKWGTQEGYAFLWDAYRRQHDPPLIAVARPHQVIFTGDTVTLDGTRSWSKSGKIAGYQWQFGDGTSTATPQVERTYSKPGRYSEILRISDDTGNLAYDFAVVVVVDREHPDRAVPSIHPNYFPTMGIRPGDPVTFKVRTFNTTTGKELWDFGDGSAKVEVQSDGNAVKLAPDGYAVTTHRYEKPGDYVVRVSRTNEHGVVAVGHLHVHVEGNPDRAAISQPPQGASYSTSQYEVLAEQDRRVSMRDGVELMVDIFRPQAEGRFPAVLLQTPYNKSGQVARAKDYAARGYVVVNTDSRGRFESRGQWDPFSPKHKTDGYDLVQWIAQQPWCNGNVGTYGLSYMGWTQWWTASQAPPALKAIVPEVAPPDQFYNAPYQNGILVCWMMDWAGMMSGRRPHVAGPGPYGGFAVRREEAYARLPYIDFDKTRGFQSNDWWRKWIRQNTAGGDYWQGIAYQTPERYESVKVPSLAITGWFDANFPGTPMNYLGMKEHGGTPAARRPRMVIGPWEHIINRHRVAAGVDFGRQATIDWNGYVLRWFDYHLKGISNGVLDDPPVHLFVMGRNQWRAAEDWPLPQTQFTRFYLHSQGQANSSTGDGALSTQPPADEPADRYTYDPHDPTPSAAFANGHIDGPRDISHSARRPDVLVYETEPLTEDMEIVGPITARLFAATSAHDTDWMIRLADVHPDGRALFLGEGVIRARHRDPSRRGAFNPNQLSTIEPHQPYEYTIEFWRPTGNVFLRGHRIRIEISSSYYPYYLRNPNSSSDNIGLVKGFQSADQAVFHDAARPSYVLLPVIPTSESAP